MTLVAALQVGVMFGIASGLGIVPSMQKEPPPITSFPDEPRRTDDPLPAIPDPKFETQDFIPIPMPDNPPIDNGPDVIATQPADPGEPPLTGSADPQPQIVGPRPDSRFPLTRPQYSPRMIREGNQGAIDLEVYVLPSGRVGDARVVKSTGFEDLDNAALMEAKRNWRLMPATRDGVPIAQWHRLRVVFKLNTR